MSLLHRRSSFHRRAISCVEVTSYREAVERQREAAKPRGQHLNSVKVFALFNWSSESVCDRQILESRLRTRSTVTKRERVHRLMCSYQHHAVRVLKSPLSSPDFLFLCRFPESIDLAINIHSTAVTRSALPWLLEESQSRSPDR